jgi:hypothetical protein
MRILEQRSFLPGPLRIFWIDANHQFSFATNKKITFGYIWLLGYIWLHPGYVLATKWLRIGYNLATFWLA